jgi:hypothetical protein
LGNNLRRQNSYNQRNNQEQIFPQHNDIQLEK